MKVVRVEQCPTCDQPLPRGNAYEIVQLLTDTVGWWEWERKNEGTEWDVNGLGKVVVVAKSIVYNEEQGEDRPVFMIFEIGGKFYRKNGTADSYGDRDWEYGSFKEVKPVTKEVVAYE